MVITWGLGTRCAQCWLSSSTLGWKASSPEEKRRSRSVALSMKWCALLCKYDICRSLVQRRYPSEVLLLMSKSAEASVATQIADRRATHRDSQRCLDTMGACKSIRGDRDLRGVVRTYTWLVRTGWKTHLGSRGMKLWLRSRFIAGASNQGPCAVPKMTQDAPPISPPIYFERLPRLPIYILICGASSYPF